MAGTSRLMALAVLFGGLAGTPAWAVPIYKSADFAGGLNSVTSSMKNALMAAGFNAALFNCSTCAGATSVPSRAPGAAVSRSRSMPMRPRC